MAIVHKIEPNIPTLKKRKRVAAYARVSMETELLHHSLSAQVSHYSSLIQSNPDWEYAGVYADEGITVQIPVKRDDRSAHAERLIRFYRYEVPIIITECYYSVSRIFAPFISKRYV